MAWSICWSCSGSRSSSDPEARRRRPAAARTHVPPCARGPRARSTSAPVRRELDEVVDGQVAAARVADDDRDPDGAGALQPGQDTSGERRVIPAIAGQDDVDVGRVVIEDIATDHADAMAGGPRVEVDRGRREDVDVGRRDRSTRPPAARRSRTAPSPTRGRRRAARPRSRDGRPGSARSRDRPPRRRPSRAMPHRGRRSRAGRRATGAAPRRPGGAGCPRARGPVEGASGAGRTLGASGSSTGRPVSRR